MQKTKDGWEKVAKNTGRYIYIYNIYIYIYITHHAPSKVSVEFESSPPVLQ